MNKLFCIACLSALSLSAQTPSRIWDATINYGQQSIPFRFEFSGTGNDIRVSFFNGDVRVTSTAGRLDGKSLSLNFDHLGTKLEATFEDGAVKGTYGGRRGGSHEFEAHPHKELAPDSATAPDVAGVWEIPTESRKGEHAWRFIVRQDGQKISAAILRVDGDTGLLTGEYRNGKFALSLFDGARAQKMDIAVKEDGSLDLSMQGGRGGPTVLNAVRPAVAEGKGIVPANFATHTGVKNPDEPFAFSFPDLKGNIVSNTDAKFRDKVVIVNITGSWCPNCHDEAPYLAELYRKYKALGLEIVALDFEDADELKDPSRLPAFIKNYKIEYTYLRAGETSELNAKVPQAVNLNSWPTTFFLGRDGKVRAVHAGFAAEASGQFHSELQKEYTSTIERLLAENVRAAR